MIDTKERVMDESLLREPLARALLQHLSEKQDKNEPLGSFARTVLDGEAALREAARFSWHANGLAKATATGLEDLARMSADQRATFNREADQYRERLDELKSTEGDATR